MGLSTFHAEQLHLGSPAAHDGLSGGQQPGITAKQKQHPSDHCSEAVLKGEELPKCGGDADRPAAAWRCSGSGASGR